MPVHKSKSPVSTIIFANSAGAARQESNDPEALGNFLKSKFSKKVKVDAIGLSEIVIATGTDGRTVFDDLDAFEKGFYNQGQAPRKFFFPHLDSKRHRHLEASENKWKGQKASPRIASSISNGQQVTQGTGALLFRSFEETQGHLIRGAGAQPSIVQFSDPLDYLGTRDTEPRSAIIIRKLELSNGVSADLAFCQLETRVGEPRTGPRKLLDSTQGAANRIGQIERLVQAIEISGTKRPTILMGDFNCRPGSIELAVLCGNHGFLQVFPSDVPLTSSYKKNRITKHSTLKRSARIPDPNKNEEEQGWPFTHLGHRILIDHAFIRGFNLDRWSFSLDVIPLPNENKNQRISDHRPIALSIQPKP